MVLLDASALLAHLRDEPAGAEVEALIREGDAGIAVANLSEVIDKTLRRTTISPDELDGLLDSIIPEQIVLRSLDADVARRGGRLRAKHHDRLRSPLSLADCLLLASAEPGDSIATSDGPLLRAAIAEKIATVPLPDSSGRRPL